MYYKVGDIVKIVDNGYEYTTYDRWVNKYAPEHYNRYVGAVDDTPIGSYGSILATGRHHADGKKIYLVGTHCDTLCLISGEGIKLLEGSFTVEEDIVSDCKLGGKTIVWSEVEDLLKENSLIINCKTEEDADDLLYNLDRLDYEWASGDALLSDNFFDEYLDETFYRVSKMKIYSDNLVTFGRICLPQKYGETIYGYVSQEMEVEECCSEPKNHLFPKTYLFWEVIKELMENPEKKFRRRDDALEIKVNDDGDFVRSTNSCHESSIKPLHVDDIWVEVNQSVSFEDAFEVFTQQDKDIYCVYKGDRYNFEHGVSEDVLFNSLWIENGEWFVE